MKDFENILNHSDHLLILKEKLKSDNFIVLESKWAPLSENVEGYLGEHYILTLKYTIDDHLQEYSFFIKTKPKSNPAQLQVTEKLNTHYKESFLYMEIFKKFEDLGYDVTFAPKCYYCKNYETLVLEDLRTKGFELVKSHFLTMDECKAALKVLAKFQACSLAFEETMSMEFGRKFRLDQEYPKAFQEIFYTPLRKTLNLEYDAATTNCILELSKLLPETPEWKADFISKVGKFDPTDVFEIELPYRKTIGHGDLWTNNMLFRKDSEEKTVECTLVDFQVVRHHHPALEALMILYLCTTSSFRKDFKKELLDFHYEEMGNCLASYGYELGKLLPKEDYMESSRVYEPVACFQGCGNRSITLLSREITSEIVKSSDQAFHNLLFSDLRTNLAIAAFQTDEKFRKIISQDMYDLYSVL